MLKWSLRRAESQVAATLVAPVPALLSLSAHETSAVATAGVERCRTAAEKRDYAVAELFGEAEALRLRETLRSRPEDVRSWCSAS